jgi:formylmethanofuran:tetrahydromethanopterin formyltransferase
MSPSSTKRIKLIAIKGVSPDALDRAGCLHPRAVTALAGIDQVHQGNQRSQLVSVD